MFRRQKKEGGLDAALQRLEEVYVSTDMDEPEYRRRKTEITSRYLDGASDPSVPARRGPSAMDRVMNLDLEWIVPRFIVVVIVIVALSIIGSIIGGVVDFAQDVQRSSQPQQQVQPQQDFEDDDDFEFEGDD